jgi:hypothetical protein
MVGWFSNLSSASSKVIRRGCVLSPSDELLSEVSAWVTETVACSICWSSLSDSDTTAACVLRSMVLLKAIAGVSLSRILQ